MMKIHTTQNLNTLVGNQRLSTNSKVSRLNYYDQTLMSAPYLDNLSFKGKSSKKANDIAKKIVVEGKKVVEEISEKAAIEEKSGDKFLKGSFFNALLKVADCETMVQAAISAVVCMVLRPLTIMGISNDKSKQDNMYASAHSMASGATGLISTALITNPFKIGEGYAFRTLIKNMKEDALTRLFPHIDLATIKDAAGKRVDTELWKDKAGNKFIENLKDVSKIPAFKEISAISADTFKALGADVNWAEFKGKSFNEVITKDGKSLYDAIDWNHLGIKVQDPGSKKPISVLLKNLDKEFLGKVISEAENESIWKKLDINSVYDAKGLVKDFREWKEIGSGKQWKFNLDSSFISSARETADYIPEISGKVREVVGDENKYMCYLKNGQNNRLGTEISQDMYDADMTNAIHKKLIIWLPDIISRPFVAMGTIALIPWMLKNIFNLEKSPKKEEVNEGANKEISNTEKTNTISIASKETTASDKVEDVDNEAKVNKEVAFKGKNDASWITRLFGKYGQAMYEAKWAHNFSEKFRDVPGNMTEHMATLGAAVTSSVYVGRTLNNQSLDDERKKTLAINQVLCFIVPTICAYTISAMLSNLNKKIEYRYSGLMEQKLATGELTQEAAEKLKKALPNNLKGVRIFSGLVTFTLIYRYLTPVLVTPIANKISDKIREHKEAKKAQKVA